MHSLVTKYSLLLFSLVILVFSCAHKESFLAQEIFAKSIMDLAANYEGICKNRDLKLLLDSRHTLDLFDRTLLKEIIINHKIQNIDSLLVNTDFEVNEIENLKTCHVSDISKTSRLWNYDELENNDYSTQIYFAISYPIKITDDIYCTIGKTVCNGHCSHQYAMIWRKKTNGEIVFNKRIY